MEDIVQCQTDCSPFSMISLGGSLIPSPIGLDEYIWPVQANEKSTAVRCTSQEVGTQDLSRNATDHKWPRFGVTPYSSAIFSCAEDRSTVIVSAVCIRAWPTNARDEMLPFIVLQRAVKSQRQPRVSLV